MTGTHKGACFCGAVEIEATGRSLEMGYCHCRDCRTYSGGPMVAFTLWKAEDVRVTKGADFLGQYSKSEMSVRRFCTKCGGHVMVEHPTLGLTDVHAPVLSTIEFAPSVHLNYGAPMLRVHDDLPKLRDFPAAAGGSGETVAE